MIDLAVIRFPRISNFTDFNVFERLEGVSVRYVSSVQELGQPDMIFLPGSKNTMGDLRWMRQNGLEAAVKKLAAHIPVWGICGGYQMLGRTISDPHGVENENSLREPLYPAHCEAISHEPDTIAVERIKRDGALPLRGMELIDTDTTRMPEKMRTQTRGKFENVTGHRTVSGTGCRRCIRTVYHNAEQTSDHGLLDGGSCLRRRICLLPWTAERSGKSNKGHDDFFAYHHDHSGGQQLFYGWCKRRPCLLSDPGL